MNEKQFSDRIGNVNDKLIQQAEQTPSYGREHRKRSIRQLAAIAATVALMACSFTAGALGFAKETIVEVPEKQEVVELADIGVTMILPESWEGKYEVVEDIFVPYQSAMWEFCVKSVYDAKTPADGADDLFYRGTLLTVFQCADYSMSTEEFEETGLSGIGRYLFATKDATYAVIYASDVQVDPKNAELTEEWNFMEQATKEIRFVIANVLG